MEMLVAVLATLGFSSCAVVAVVIAVRRQVRTLRMRALALRDRAALAARAQGVGPAAEAARLRRAVDRSLAGARRAHAAALSVGAPVGDVRSLIARLELAARSVDGELQMVEAQPDRSRAATALAGPRARVAVITASVGQLVDGLVHASGHDHHELTLLHAACSLEADALRSVTALTSR